MIRVVHPGSDADFLPIPDPGVKKAPDPGSGSSTLLMDKGDEQRRRLSYEELQLREGSGSEENWRSGQTQLQVSSCRLTCMYHTHKIMACGSKMIYSDYASDY
jgi:hypothetical protein